MKLKNPIQWVRGWIVRGAIGLRNHLTISVRSKRRVRHHLFRRFPYIFRSFKSYQDWLILNPRPGSSPSVGERGLQRGDPSRCLLVVSHDAQGHGAQLLTLGMVAALRQELEVEVILLLGGGRLKPEFEALVPVHQLNEFDSGVSDIRILAQSLADRGFTKAIVSTTASGSIVPAFSEADIQSICLVHELPGVIASLQLQTQARQIASSAKAVVFPASIVAEGFAQFARVDIARQIIRPQGLYRKNEWRTRKESARAALADRLGLATGTKVVLAVGYADERKGADLFVESALRIAAIRNDVDFVWVGDWNPVMRDNIESNLHDSPHKGRIHFVGYEADTSIYHAGSDVFALTSREDPFPNVVLESFDVGVPVVAFASTGGAASLVEQVGGIVVPAQDTAAFSAAICDLLERPGLSERLGKAAQHHIEEHFSFQAYLKDICGEIGVEYTAHPYTLETDFLSGTVHQSLQALSGKRVLIILAACNGGKFIAEQIKSIQKQIYCNWELLVRDDHSSDNTAHIVLCMAEKDRRISLVQDDFGNLGAIGNFGVLMEKALESGADYLFFADQDDDWHPEKMGTMLDAMLRLEAAVGSDVPLLAHSDLVVVDESLTEMAESFVRYSKLSPASADFGVLLCQNQVTGCAAVVNRKLLELACPVPEQILMHDWWLAQLAAAAGKIGYVPASLVRYRQHGNNVLGAVSLWARVFKLLTSVREWEKFADFVRGSVVQARLLRGRLSARSCLISPLTEGRLEAYARLLAQQRLTRLLLLRKWNIGKPGWAKGWVFNLVVFGMKGNHDE